MSHPCCGIYRRDEYKALREANKVFHEPARYSNNLILTTVVVVATLVALIATHWTH